MKIRGQSRKIRNRKQITFELDFSRTSFIQLFKNLGDKPNTLHLTTSHIVPMHSYLKLPNAPLKRQSGAIKLPLYRGFKEGLAGIVGL